MNTTPTNDQITAGAAVLCDHGQPIGRNAAIEVADAMQAASPAETLEPVAYLRWWARQINEGHGNIGHEEGFEVCEAHEASDDGTPAFPVYVTQATPSPQIAEKVELPSIDTPEFQALVEGWRKYPYGTREFLIAWDAIIAHVDHAIAASRRAAGGMSIEIKHAPAGKTDFARGEILGYEGSPTRFMVVGEDDLYLHTFILGTGMYWGVRKEEPNLACLVRYSAAQPASAGQAAPAAADAAGANEMRIALVTQLNELIDLGNRYSGRMRGKDDEESEYAQGACEYARRVMAPYNYNGGYRPTADEQDAKRYRYIATLRDWSDIEQMCWSSTARSASQFKRDLDKYIDAKLVKAAPDQACVMREVAMPKGLTRYSMWSNAAAHGMDPSPSGEWVAFDELQDYIAAQPAEGAGQAGQVASDYTDPTIACCDCGLTMGESTLLGHIALGKLKVISGRAAAPAEQPSAQKGGA